METDIQTAPPPAVRCDDLLAGDSGYGGGAATVALVDGALREAAYE